MTDTIIAFVISFCLGLAALFVVLSLFSGFASADFNERSNHSRPTPQIGGLALVPIFVLAMIAFRLAGEPIPVFSDWGFLAAVLILLATGILDDRVSLGALPKLALQFLAAAVAVTALGDVLDAARLPYALSALAAFAALVAIINLSNFLDGLDLMAVATIGVPGVFFALLAMTGAIGLAFGPAGAVSAGLFLAFISVNRPPAKAFLGDAGSLPFGLILGAMTVVVACRVSPIAALLLPAYMLCDGLVTIMRRTFRGENILHAHSSHVYQRAFRTGRPVLVVIGATATVGAAAGFALLATAGAGIGWHMAAVLAAFVLWWSAAAWLMRDIRA
ncbi:glycosyl transferase [Mesorhizobium sp. L-8-10]|uniref:glycoside hydrolase n=1 Tax=Mesorhizobium sp. L-8-10 TaxID=2744523 RepID=UPI001928C09B|nr:glycoside hydrolase [Mesorhizobium sp. L-8-10]BCH34075.1 glycosyl transferase [Mesorhizobium sp. L-8-10]